MRIQNIRPLLHHISYFKYVIGEYRYPKISLEKSQYVYHILLIDKGKLDVCVGGKTERIAAGEAVYLLPGEVYRLLPCGEDFSLYNLFFDFLEDRSSNEAQSGFCVFINNYNPKLCLPRVDFEDAAELNKSGIVKKLSADNDMRSLVYMDRADALYSFYGRAVMFSVIADTLTSIRESNSKGSVGKKILEYINRNPEKELSGKALSKIFSYHPNHINKLIKKEAGKTLSEYTRYVKIKYAKTLLSEGNYSLTEISLRLGYYDYSHFYKSFLLETGQMPTEYRRKLCEDEVGGEVQIP